MYTDIVGTVTKQSRKCICGTTILDHNWCLKVLLIGGKALFLHDNDICEYKFRMLNKERLSMRHKFLATRPVYI